MSVKIIALAVIFIVAVGVMALGLAAGAAALKTDLDQMYEDIDQEKYIREYLEERERRKAEKRKDKEKRKRL